jgi:methylase of polypeptide subunit release factors
MAKQITKRTLVGYKNIPVNAHYFEDIINMLKNKPKQFRNRVLKPSYWKKVGVEEMKFDAVVGNPPYMEMDGGAQASARPIYQYFVSAAKGLNPNYLSFIMPTRWYAGGKGLDGFRDEMLNDEHLEVLYDCLSPEDIFPNTNIRGGVCYFLWNKEYNNAEKLTQVITLEHGKNRKSVMRPLKIDEMDIFIRHSEAIGILSKVFSNKDTDVLMNYVSPLRPF